MSFRGADDTYREDGSPVRYYESDVETHMTVAALGNMTSILGFRGY